MTAKIDVSLFVPSLGGGGAERVVVMLSNEFARRGLRVEVVLATALGPYRKDLREDVGVVCFGTSTVASSFPHLATYLQRNRPGALLCALKRANVVGLAARAAVGAKLPVLISEHSNISASTGYDGGRFGKLLPFLMRRTYPRADSMVAVSAGVADDLSQSLNLSRDRIAVIHNPVDFSRIRSMAEEDPQHPWLSPKTRPVIVSAGRLHPSKDYGTLIRAFCLLRQTQPCRLVILGEGDEEERLRAVARSLELTDDDIDFAGFKENPFAFMKRADAFALSSRFEGLGNVLIEAMACGCRVVSTDCPSGPAEVLEHGRWGSLTTVGDAAGLAEALGVAINESRFHDPTERARSFSIEVAADRYLAELAGEGSR